MSIKILTAHLKNFDYRSKVQVPQLVAVCVAGLSSSAARVFMPSLCAVIHNHRYLTKTHTVARRLTQGNPAIRNRTRTSQQV